MNKQLEQIHEITARKERVHTILKKNEGDALWDTMKARDVDPEILEHVQYELSIGKDLRTIRREMGIRSQTCRAWVKISAALKAGWRIDSAGYFITCLNRQEIIAKKLSDFVNGVFDHDESRLEALMETDKKGVPLLDTFVKYVTPMIDALGRNQKTTVELGKMLGVFQESNESAKGPGGNTIIVQNNVVLPTPKEILDAKRKPDVVVPKA